MPRPSLNPHPPHLSPYKNNSCIICPNSCPLPPSQLPCVSLSAMCFSIFSTTLLPLCPVSSSPHLMLHPQLEHFHSDPLTYLQPSTTNALILAPGFDVLRLSNASIFVRCITIINYYCGNQVLIGNSYRRSQLSDYYYCSFSMIIVLSDPQDYAFHHLNLPIIIAPSQPDH
jgi:hypothetical protein